MLTKITKWVALSCCLFGLKFVTATEIYPFFLQRPDGTILEGYFSPPIAIDQPIVFAAQGSFCESTESWHKNISDHINALGFGVIAIEKPGISKGGIDFLEYHRSNCLQKRLEDSLLCLNNLEQMCPEWNGKVIFWGESEGGKLAAQLAAETSQTAALLLFATGGGLNPREEVKYTLNSRLENHGAQQDEIDEYMGFLEEQMDAMIEDPTPHKQFLGNTYKWWSSLLATNDLPAVLSQKSLPIFLVHGVVDSLIPIFSADLAAKNLNETNNLTYHRLEEYGHNMNTDDVHAAACQWLNCILNEKNQWNPNLFAFTSETPIVKDWKSDIAHYIFSLGGEVYADLKANTDSDGNSKASVDVGANLKSDSGWSADLKAGASTSTDNQGNTKNEAHAEVRVGHGF